MNSPRPYEIHEAAVVGRMLLQPAEIADVIDLVAEPDLASPKLRAVYRAIVRVVDRREPVDIPTIHAELARAGEIALAGGLEGLGELSAAGVGAYNVRHHAQQVAAYARVRELGANASDVAEDCRKLQHDPRELLNRAQEALLPSMAVQAELEPMTAVIHRTFRGIVKRRDHGVTGALTYLTDLDELLLGMDPGNLYVIGARPGQGKTALATSILLANARRKDREGKPDGNPGGILTLEMPAAQLTERLLCAAAGVDNQAVRKGVATAKELARLVSAADRLSAMPFQVLDLHDQPGTMRHIRASARAWRRRYPKADRPIFALDYLGLVDGPEDNPVERIGRIAWGCKRLAGELGCAFLLLAQLNRGPEGRSDKRPGPADLRGSGEIEQHADGILFIYRGSREGDTSMRPEDADLILAKHRHGPTGTVRVRWIGSRTLFCNPRRESDDRQEVDEGP